MSTPSSAFIQIKKKIIDAKNGTITVVTPEPTDPDQALEFFRNSMHAFVNNEYMHDHGLTEDEADELHSIIDNEPVEIKTDGKLKPRPPQEPTDG